MYCALRTSTSPQISKDRGLTISGRAESQQSLRSEGTEERTGDFVGSIQCNIQTEEFSS